MNGAATWAVGGGRITRVTILLAVLAGGALGYVFERGDFCFHSTWRRLVRTPRDVSLFRSYLVVLLISTPFVQLLIATGVIDPFIPPFAWRATVLGGLVFAAGMVVAKTCITGMFYKLGHGMLGMVVALAAWGIGDVVTYRGPLRSLRESLNDGPITATDEAGESVATVTSLFGAPGVVVMIIAGGVATAYLARSFAQGDATTARGKLLGWLPLGLATAVVMVVGWLLVRWHGFDYSFGTSSVPTQLWNAGRGDGGGPMWIPLSLASLVPGAFIAARRSGTFWVRGETGRRFAELAAGGFLMGVGAAIAGGCNLGHSMVGVPLLSLGSISATIAMIVGVAMFNRLSRPNARA